MKKDPAHENGILFLCRGYSFSDLGSSSDLHDRIGIVHEIYGDLIISTDIRRRHIGTFRLQRPAAFNAGGLIVGCSEFLAPTAILGQEQEFPSGRQGQRQFETGGIDPGEPL